ncbi:MAG: hypothetical protein WBD87_14165 [Candidatus Acidiferrales bacterium]
MSDVVQVSTDNAQRNHSEVIAAADPSDPNRLLACSMIQPLQPSAEISRNVSYLSVDGGLHWSPTLEFGGDLWASDPSCVFGRNHLAVYAGLDFSSAGRNWFGKTVFYKSLDGGSTWSSPSILSQGDREFITMDEERNSIYVGEIVDGVSLNGSSKSPLVLYESGDAASFQTRAVVSAGDEIRIFGYPGGILPGGAFATALSAIPESAALLGKPSNVTGTVRVLLYNAKERPAVAVHVVSTLHECDGWRNSTPMPSLAVDASSGDFRGRMYVAWPDERSGRCEILFSSSADEGVTWSTPIVVDDDEASNKPNAGPDDFHPVVAVNRRGIVGVLWYDRREDPDNLSWQPRFSASVDGGETFLPSVSVGSGMKLYQGERVGLAAMSEGGGTLPFRSGGAIRISFGYSGHSLTGGETAGLAADASGAFHAMWIDNCTGIRQVWTARLSVNGSGENNGSSELTTLDDVSNDVTILFSHETLDRVKQTFTTDVYVQNTSDASIGVPLKLRALRLTSEVGKPEFVNADNRRLGADAVFDLTALMLGDTLKPGEKTGARKIIIHFRRGPSELPPGDYQALSGIVAIDFAVLGKQLRPHKGF